MHGRSRSGEDETERTSKDRRTDDSGSLARGAANDLRGGAEEDGDSGCRRLLAATEVLALPVLLTRRLLVWAVLPWARGTRTDRTAFIGLVAMEKEVIEGRSRREGRR